MAVKAMQKALIWECFGGVFCKLLTSVTLFFCEKFSYAYEYKTSTQLLLNEWDCLCRAQCVLCDDSGCREHEIKSILLFCIRHVYITGPYAVHDNVNAFFQESFRTCF